jgi:hypothetical protein
MILVSCFRHHYSHVMLHIYAAAHFHTHDLTNTSSGIDIEKIISYT